MTKSRLEELTERARRTLAQTTRPAPVEPVGTVGGLPALPPVPALPHVPGRAIKPAAGGEVVIGIDPGTATMGYGLVRAGRGSGEALGDFELVEFGTLTTPAGEPMERRLLTLYAGLRDLLRTYRPSHAVV